MAQLPSRFKSDEHEKMNSFSAIPAGKYLVEIVESEIRLSKKKVDQKIQGQYIWLKFRVVSGKNKGAFLFRNLNIVNESTQAVEIANREFATICDATGVQDVRDTIQLHNIPVLADVIVRPSTPNQPAQNEIKFYSKPTKNDLDPAPEGRPNESTESNSADDGGNSSDESDKKQDKNSKNSRPWMD